MRERDIFIDVLDVPAGDRAKVLDRACHGDPMLRAQVEQLLAEHARQESFILDSPPAGVDATLDFPLLTERPGVQVGPYRLLQQIGEGGMGVVFMAEQTEPIRRTVALKIIKPGMDTRQVIARFEAERQALALMDHPNIAKVLDAGTTESGRPYFVMELVKGVPITQYCDERQLSIRARLELIVPVCQAVQHAHQKGLIHRDIKPSNVLVAEYDDHVVPKVIDFGVAKATAQKMTDRTMFTEFGQVVGTVEYMSPEQAKFNQLDIDTRSDIYSLGVLLYELLTGSTPFGRDRLSAAAFDEMLRIIREEEPPRPSTRLSTAEGLPSIAASRGSEPLKLNRVVRGELDWVVMKALEKDRNRRYQTATGLAADIQRYLDDEAVQACPPSATYRFGKFARRHKGGLLAGAGVVATLVLLVLGLAASNLLIAAERNQKAAALIEKEEALASAKASQETAQAESKRAEEGFLRASIAIREVLTKAAMGSGEWSQLPRSLRKQFGVEAVKFYEDLLQGTSDPNSQYQAAVGFRAIGTLHTTSEEPRQAEESFRRSIAILDRLTIERPANQKYQHQLAWSLFNLGRVLRDTHRIEEAKSTLHKGVALYEALLVQSPNSFDFCSELATCHLELARCHEDALDFNAGAEAVRAGIEVLKSAAPQPHEALPYEVQSTRLYLILGAMKAGSGEVKEARAAFGVAADRYGDMYSREKTVSNLLPWLGCYQRLIDLPTDDPRGGIIESEKAYHEYDRIKSGIPDELKSHRELRELSGHVQRIWAYKLWSVGRVKEAEQSFVVAATVFDRLTSDEPDVSKYWHFGADTQRLIAELMAARGERDEAVQALRRSIELFEQGVAGDTTKQVNKEEWARPYFDLARLLIKSGELEEALRLVSRGLEITPQNDEQVQILNALQQIPPLSQILANEPKEVQPWIDRASCYLVLRQFPKAAADYTEAINRKPDDSELFRPLGNAYAAMGQWEQAHAPIEQAATLNPTDLRLLYQWAALSLYANKQESYQRACDNLLRLYEGTDNMQEADCTIKACALASGFGGEAGKVIALSKRATFPIEPPYVPEWFVVSKALVDYRADRYDAAADAIVGSSPAMDFNRDALAYSILAMARHQQGAAREAGEALARAQQIIALKIPKVENGDNFGDDWHDWLHALLLCREAEVVLGDAKTRGVE
jgi:serine/threonine protein kinase